MSDDWTRPLEAEEKTLATTMGGISKESLKLWLGGREESEYDPAQFYLGNARAGKEGNGTNIQTRFRPVHTDIIDAIVGTSSLPYTSRASFLRDAAVHRGMYLRQHATDSRLRTVLEDLYAVAEANETAKLLEELMEEADQMDDQIDRLMRGFAQLDKPVPAYRLLLQWKRVWERNVEIYGIGDKVLESLQRWADKIKPDYDAEIKAERRLASVETIAMGADPDDIGVI